MPPYFRSSCRVPVDAKFSLDFDKINFMQRQVRVFAAAPDSMFHLQVTPQMLDMSCISDAELLALFLQSIN